MSGNMLRNFMRLGLKSLVFIGLFVVSFVNLSQAKMSAKDASKEIIESIFGENVDYNCIGDNKNATCVIKNATINGISLQDAKVTSQIDSKDANFTLSGKIATLPPSMSGMQEFAPKNVQCKANMSLRANINAVKLNCLLKSESYNLKADVNMDLQSKIFEGREIAEVMASKEDANDMKILVKIITLDFDGIRFGDRVFAYTKKSTPEMTREQFNAQVNVMVTSVPLMMANEKSMSPEVIAAASSAAMGVGSILTNKSKGMSITLRPKSLQFVPLEKFESDMNADSGIEEIFKTYDVKIKTK